MNRTFRAIIALGLGMLPAVQYAQVGASAKFTVKVIVTAEGDALYKAWDSGRLGFNVVPVRAAARGQFLSAIVLFTGCQPDSSGNCNAEMGLTAYDPSGKVYGEMPNAELWKSKPAPTSGATQLSRDFMGIVIEPADRAGTYRVVVVARDMNAKREAKAETSFSIK